MVTMTSDHRPIQLEAALPGQASSSTDLCRILHSKTWTRNLVALPSTHLPSHGAPTTEGTHAEPLLPGMAAGPCGEDRCGGEKMSRGGKKNAMNRIEW